MTREPIDEKAVFNSARRLAVLEERVAYLQQVCGHEPKTLHRILELLNVHFQQSSFLESPALAPGATIDTPTEGPGTLIGPYKLLEQIGEGGMGLVFMAEQTRPVRRRVALKVIKPGMDTRHVVVRFEAERQALALMDHPNIAKIHDGGTTASGRPYFVMELVRGVPITEFCDQRRFTTRQRLELFVTVCQAVQHAHQKGIIHRDLKPSNVLVTLHDVVAVPKIIDFGIAKATTQPLTERTLFTHFAQMIGTPLYMSPEQAEMNGLDVDTRSDVYALGVLLYELLTGTTPFESQTLKKVGLDEMRRMIREEEPPTPSQRLSTLAAQVCSTVSEQRGVDGRRLAQVLRGELDWIVMKALEKDRSRRYESASAFAADVLRYLSDEPVQACPPSPGYRFWKFARRNKVALVTAGLVAAALVIGTAVSVWQAVEANDARKLAGERFESEKQAHQEIEASLEQVRQREREVRQHLYVQDIMLAWQALREEERERMRGLLDRHIPEAGQEDLRGFEWYYLQRRSRGVLHEAARVAAHEGGAYCVKYSPDGRTLASAGKDAVIRFWDARTLRPQGQLRSGQGEVNEIAFTPDGKSLASAGDDRTVWVWDLACGRRRDVLRPEGCRDELSTLAISPDGKILAAGGKDGGIWSWDFASGTLKARLNPGAGWTQHMTFAPDGRFLATANDGRILLLDPATLQERCQLKCPPGMVNCVSFSHDGKTLAADHHWPGRIVLWNLTTQKQGLDLYQESIIRSLSFSPDDTLLVSGADDGRVKLWDPRSADAWALWDSVRGHAGRVWSTAFAPDGEWLATAGQDGAVKLWHVLGGDDRRTIRVASEAKTAGEVVWLAFSANGQTLFTHTLDGELGRWSTLSGQREEPAGWLATPITRAALAPASRLVTMASDQRELCVQDLSGTVVQVYRHAQPILAFAISPNGERVAFADDLPAVWLWEVDAGQPRELSRLPAIPSCLAFAPDGGSIAVAAASKIRILDTARGQSLAVMNVLWDFPPGAVAFSPDGRLLGAVAVWTDNAVRIWELPSGRDRYSLWKPRTSVGTTIAFSPDGKTLASGNLAGEVILWNVAGGKELMRLNDRLRRCNSLAFSPDGKILAAGGLGADAKSAVTFWYADGARPNPER